MAEQNNVLQFEADLQRFSHKFDLDFATVVKVVVFELLRKIILKTAVDTGRASASWGVSKGQPGEDMKPEGEYPKPDAAVVQSMVDSISFENPYAVYWIYNNLPYIETLEFGLYPKHGSDGKGKSPSGKTQNGYSIQTPAGMVRVSLAEVETDLYEEESSVD